MLPIVDKPVVQYIVEEMVASGIEEIVIVTSQAKRAIEDHFDKNFELEYRLEKAGKLDLLEKVRDITRNVKISYTRQPEPLGNGHALLCAKELLNNGPFVFSDGDSIIDSEKPLTKQIIEAYDKYKSPIIAVKKIEGDGISIYGVIDGDNLGKGVYMVKKIVEKPEFKDAPSDIAILGMRYILTPEIFNYLEKQRHGKSGEIWLSDAMDAMCKDKDIYAYEYEGKYYDTGNKLEYLKAVVEFGLKHPELNGEFKDYICELSKTL